MTLAIDKISGEVLGQVLEAPAVVAAAPSTWSLTILTGQGVRTVRACDVRLEVVR